MAPAAYGASFSADSGSLGAIPDGTNTSQYGSPLDVTFTVDGLPSNTSISDVGVSFQMNPGHTWIGDLDVVLIAPGGAPSQTIFSRVGATSASSAGVGSNLI